MTLRLLTAQEFLVSRYADVADQLDDIDDIIEQAQAFVESSLDRTLSETDYTELYRPNNDLLFLRQRPIIAVDSVERRISHNNTWEVLDETLFEIEPNGASGVLLDPDGFIKGYQVRVSYSAGYTDIPADIKAAVILAAVSLSFQDFEVFGVGDGREPAIRHIQNQIDRLIMYYKKIKIH